MLIRLYCVISHKTAGTLHWNCLSWRSEISGRSKSPFWYIPYYSRFLPSSPVIHPVWPNMHMCGLQCYVYSTKLLYVPCLLYLRTLAPKWFCVLQSVHIRAFVTCTSKFWTLFCIELKFLMVYIIKTNYLTWMQAGILVSQDIFSRKIIMFHSITIYILSKMHRPNFSH